MLKEFFLVDYKSLSSFKEITTPMIDMAVQGFLTIAAIAELFKGFIGKSNVESRITIFILAAFSILMFNEYNQKVLDASFEISDQILKKSQITNMSSLSDILKSSPNDQVKKNEESANQKNGNSLEFNNILDSAKFYIANHVAISLAWLFSVLAIMISRLIFTVIYYALVVLAPLIVFISVFPGFEGSLKAFWQAFMWCFISPIVFAVIFALIHIISKNEVDAVGLDTLVSVLVYGVFLAGSFILSFKIASSQPMTGFAEKASMVGALAAAAPLVGASTFAQAAVTRPMQTASKLQKGLSSLNYKSKQVMPHSGIKDISKMSPYQMTKSFGKKFSEQVLVANKGNNLEESSKSSNSSSIDYQKTTKGKIGSNNFSSNSLNSSSGPRSGSVIEKMSMTEKMLSGERPSSSSNTSRPHTEQFKQKNKIKNTPSKINEHKSSMQLATGIKNHPSKKELITSSSNFKPVNEANKKKLIWK